MNRMLFLAIIIFAGIFLATTSLVHTNQYDNQCRVNKHSDGGTEINDAYGWPRPYFIKVQYSECANNVMLNGSPGRKDNAIFIAPLALVIDVFVGLVVGSSVVYGVHKINRLRTTK